MTRCLTPAHDPHTTSLTLAKLQNPIRQNLDALNNRIRNVHKAQRNFERSLKAALNQGDLPTAEDPMESHETLINRAIAMHLLREGQFGVASTFINEAQSRPPQAPNAAPISAPLSRSVTPTDEIITDADMPTDIPTDLAAWQSEALQSSFAEMYSILASLKAHDLLPAITWARSNCAELEARGSNLEFELCKLQYIWLFKGPAFNGLPDTPRNGPLGARLYGIENFGRFQHRHTKEIQKLGCALLFASNLDASPYRSIFDTAQAFEEVAASFTREFCSLLGLSAESPLYVAATAGALALPQLVKFASMAKAKGTEWTTSNELAFHTPLPRSMMYHSIFVCPVAKEQTTEDNPPVILPCGHVLARSTIQKITRGHKYKCPYCPSEGLVKDAKEIIL